MTTGNWENDLAILEQKELALVESRKSLRAAGLEIIQEMIERFDIRADEIRWTAEKKVSRKTAPKDETQVRRRRPASVKYIGPKGERWTGRGRTPQWAKFIIEREGSLERFLVR